MWVANSSSNFVTEIFPNLATTTYGGFGASPYGIAFDGVNMWTANYGNSTVTKLSPTGASSTYSVALHPVAIAFDGTNMWTTNVGGGNVTKISPTGTTTDYAMPTTPNAIAFDGTNMWTANSNDNSVTKISPTGVTTKYTVATGPNNIAFDGVNMWTTSYGDNSVTKVSPAFTASSLNYTVNTNPVPAPAVQSSSNGGFSSPAVAAQVLSSVLAPSPAATAYINSLKQIAPVTKVANPVANPQAVFNRDLKMGSRGSDVKALQIYLNNHGYTVASSGPGSLGNETTMFGNLTRNALIVFQKEHGIEPATGSLGTITRAMVGK